jgi:hypothetical protein
MTRETINKNKVVLAMAAGTHTATTNGNTVDCSGHDAVGFHVFVGPAGDTLSGTVTIQLAIQESSDGSTWAYAGDYDTIAPEPQSATHLGIGTANGATNSGTFYVATTSAPLALVGGLQPVFKGAYIGTKRYVRLVDVRTGTQTTGTPVMAVAVLSHPAYAPEYGNLS